MCSCSRVSGTLDSNDGREAEEIQMNDIRIQAKDLCCCLYSTAEGGSYTFLKAFH